MRVRTLVEPALLQDPTYEKSFGIVDGYASGVTFGSFSPDLLTLDNDQDRASPATHWVAEPELSAKQCTAAVLEDSTVSEDKATCSLLNSSWLRHFVTDQKDQDLALDILQEKPK